MSLKEHEHCIDGEGEQGYPKHDGYGKWVNRLILRDAETLAETCVAKIAEPSAEDTKNGATNDIAKEMHAQINARITVKYGIEHHCGDQGASLVKTTDPNSKTKAIGCMR